jgi:fructose/tagatose bisphosphate aldolase
MKNDIDSLIKQAVFGASQKDKENSRRKIRQMAKESGIVPASIQGLYEAAGKGLYRGITVPAMNIRGITYDVTRAVFRAAMKDKVGAFIFEMARSELEYTEQRPGEYAACILAAAIKEGFQGPVFIQGDHYQVRRAMYRQNPEVELNDIRELIKEAIGAGFLNIDIDASTLVDLNQPNIEAEQAKNSQVTADMTKFIRSIEPEGVTISIGGEIGEIGKGNSTEADLRGFMSGYLRQVGAAKGISKISVQTGTSHGGVVLPDGSIAQVNLDFKTLENLSKVAREEFGMGGAVQHGASTLPDEAFDMFPKVGTVEVHLATGFQNIIFDSPQFPKDLLNNIYQALNSKYSHEKKQGQSEEQFIYQTRKRAFGDFKREMWDMPESNRQGVMTELEERFSLLYRKLNATNTTGLVKKYVVIPS